MQSAAFLEFCVVDCVEQDYSRAVGGLAGVVASLHYEGETMSAVEKAVKKSGFVKRPSAQCMQPR